MNICVTPLKKCEYRKVVATGVDLEQVLEDENGEPIKLPLYAWKEQQASVCTCKDCDKECPYLQRHKDYAQRHLRIVARRIMFEINRYKYEYERKVEVDKKINEVNLRKLEQSITKIYLQTYEEMSKKLDAWLKENYGDYDDKEYDKDWWQLYGC